MKACNVFSQLYYHSLVKNLLKNGQEHTWGTMRIKAAGGGRGTGK
jgi:hypothetical protein